MPEILLEGEHATALEDRMLRKRQRVKAGNRNNDLDNTINNDHQTAFTKKTRHNHRGEVPKIGGCSALVGRGDGHTILDKTRQYKLCEPIHRLPECRNNFAYTWSVRTNSLNVTQQIVHCRCKKNSVTYLTKREALPNGQGYEFLFACAPQNVSKLNSVRENSATGCAINSNFSNFSPSRKFVAYVKSRASCFRCVNATRTRTRSTLIRCASVRGSTAVLSTTRKPGSSVQRIIQRTML